MLWVESNPHHNHTICLFRLVTRLDCPTCGMTRAFRAMGRLDVSEAIRYNPLGPAFFGMVVIGWVYAIIMFCSGGKTPIPMWWIHWRRHFFWGMLAVLLIVGIGRMVYELHHPPLPAQPWHFITVKSE
ncbi:MAG TPA: DUF2752 domain-containing protein [Armatimonadota bacterium]|nr:DUF2752 domain-containing protein [Armatimonadota bacterium]